MTERLQPGQRVVLEPEGLVGLVEDVFEDEGRVVFAFNSLLHGARVPVAGDRWRRLMSQAEGIAVEQDIARAQPIAGLAWRPEFVRLSSVDPEVALLRAHLEGTREQRITAYATLLDWSLAASAAGTPDGIWRGYLSEGRFFLLGELALVLGKSDAELLECLHDVRGACAAADRVPVGSPAGLPEAPLTRVEDFGWLPGPKGAYPLGTFEVEGVLSILSQGWELPGPDLDLEHVEGALCGPVEPGRWSACLFVQAEELPEDIERALADVDDFARSGVESVLCRSWLVLAHESRKPAVPEVVVGPDAGAWVAQFLGAGESDDFERVSLRVASASHALEMLERVACTDVYGARIACVGSERLTRGAASAIRATVALLGAGWGWGVTYRCGKAVGPGLPVFAAGPPERRTLLAIPSVF